jgi:hypothetical protein
MTTGWHRLGRTSDPRNGHAIGERPRRTLRWAILLVTLLSLAPGAALAQAQTGGAGRAHRAAEDDALAAGHGAVGGGDAGPTGHCLHGNGAEGQGCQNATEGDEAQPPAEAPAACVAPSRMIFPPVAVSPCLHCSLRRLRG